MEKIQTSLHVFRNTRSKHDFHAPNSNIMVAKKVHTIEKFTSLMESQTTVRILDMMQEP
jgi:S-ribosylhomocysteine lyase LuxS involved in autoinducer biosynthesis